MKNRKKILFYLTASLLIVLAIAGNHKTASNQPTDSQSGQSNLSEDERFILNPPPKEASKSALQKHAEIVAKLAKETNSIQINNCQPDPRVVKAKTGTSLQIVNADNIERMLVIDSEHAYKIPPKSSQTIKIDFKYGTGDYGYICQGEGIVGFIHVV